MEEFMNFNKRNELLGVEFETNSSGKCVVVDYNGYADISVRFYEHPCVVKCQIGRLRLGEVKNPLFPSFYNKGFIGVGEHKFIERGVSRLWNKILLRSYCEKHLEICPTYEDAEVCDEWLNFQNFAEWCKGQEFFNAEDEKGRLYHLDKDILVKGNKTYSPDTCCFVPQEINKLLSKRSASRGSNPMGVGLDKDSERFRARLSYFGKSRHLGCFKTPEEAFLAYKKAKESYIKEVAEKRKGRVDERAYQALLNYEVHIDD